MPGEGPSQQLQTWLDKPAHSFGEWLAARWDFTRESLDVLEELVRARYANEANIHARRTDPFLTS